MNVFFLNPLASAYQGATSGPLVDAFSRKKSGDILIARRLKWPFSVASRTVSDRFSAADATLVYSDENVLNRFVT